MSVQDTALLAQKEIGLRTSVLHSVAVHVEIAGTTVRQTSAAGIAELGGGSMTPAVVHVNLAQLAWNR
eukprot:2213072-Rhodomonas_salina.1